MPRDARSYAEKRAALATGFFSLLGGLGTLWVSDWERGGPLLAVYALLMFNTYFSLRLFFSIIPPEDRAQQRIDAILLLCYFLLSTQLGNTYYFLVVMTLLFAISLIKYALLLGRIDYLPLLRKKIIANSLGTILCFVVLVGHSTPYATTILLLYPLVFALGSCYFFFINSLYTLPNEKPSFFYARRGKKI